MQQNDIISSWLSGASSEGYDNPAGPLYTEGHAATEAALTDPSLGNGAMVTITVRGATTCSAARGCACC